MSRLILLLAAFIAFNANASSREIPDDTLKNYKTLEQLHLESTIFSDDLSLEEDIQIESLEVIEIEEEVTFNFDIKKYLPEGFNALEGMHDLNWDDIELIEVEEDVDLGFNTKPYLPEDFNALAGMYDLDWDTIELVEIEEEVELGFDTKDYLPKNFNPYKGMDCEKEEVVVCLY